VVTVADKTPADATLRTATHTFHGSPLRMAALSAMGNTGWREGKEYNTVVLGVGGEQRTIGQTYKTRNSANNLLVTPTGPQEYLVFGIDTRAVTTLTTEGSAVTRDELTFSVDAFNNILKRCVFDGASTAESSNPIRKTCRIIKRTPANAAATGPAAPKSPPPCLSAPPRSKGPLKNTRVCETGRRCQRHGRAPPP